MGLKLLPSESLPREKLLQKGSGALTDAELLAIFLRTGTQGINVIQLSDALINDFGSLRALFSSSQDDFCQRKGLGVAKYVQLQAVLEMSKRYLLEGLQRGGALQSAEQTKRYLSTMLRDRQREAFYVLYLDNQHRLIADEVMFEGTINAASVYPREVVKCALSHNSAAVILAQKLPDKLHTHN